MQICEDARCCVYIPKQDKWPPDFAGMHITDQAQAVFAPDGRSMVDYIGRTEHLQQDWEEIVAEINRRSGANFKAAQLENENPTTEIVDGADESVPPCMLGTYAKMYSNSALLRNVMVQYAADVERFGYLLDEAHVA